jgi:hypothetical protein
VSLTASFRVLLSISKRSFVNSAGVKFFGYDNLELSKNLAKNEALEVCFI